MAEPCKRRAGGAAGLSAGTAGAAGVGRLLDRGQVLRHLLLERALQAQVDVGAHGQPLRHFLRALDGKNLLHLLHRRGHDEGLQARGLGRDDADRRVERAVYSSWVMKPCSSIWCSVRSRRSRALPMSVRGDEVTGARMMPGEQRAFRQAQLARVLAEVAFRRRPTPK